MEISSGRLPTINRRRPAFHPGLQLERQMKRMEAGLHDIAGLEPEALLSGGLPHVTQLAFPRARIALGAGAETPAAPDLALDFRRDELADPLVHGPIAGGIDDDVGGQEGAIRHAQAV